VGERLLPDSDDDGRSLEIEAITEDKAEAEPRGSTSVNDEGVSGPGEEIKRAGLGKVLYVEPRDV